MPLTDGKIIRSWLRLPCISCSERKITRIWLRYLCRQISTY